MRVFLSWSGSRSNKIAEAMLAWLPKVIPHCDPWMSSYSISKGEKWSEKILSNLVESEIGIFFITPENATAPWMNFEAGALGKARHEACVLPLVFNMSLSALNPPMSLFQLTSAEKNDIYQMIETINSMMGAQQLKGHLLKNGFDKNWPELESKIDAALRIPIKGEKSEIEAALSSFSEIGFPRPRIFKEASFESGFESHKFYSSAVSVSKERLWIYGRKNRKLFDKEYAEFFRNLKRKVGDGYSFKVLFLDEEAPQEIMRRAHKNESFPLELKQNTKEAVEMIETHELNVDDHFRKYSIKRDSVLIFVDDAVVYCPLSEDINGIVENITQAPFSVVSCYSELGRKLVFKFEEIWSGARTF